ncbi:hypothetical protein ASG59_11770 [Methylobacterium sp. Leaf466]|nr:hypothetical protein ASG59_11770 [Methylobacterium sp. Leaf466]
MLARASRRDRDAPPFLHIADTAGAGADGAASMMMEGETVGSEICQVAISRTHHSSSFAGAGGMAAGAMPSARSSARLMPVISCSGDSGLRRARTIASISAIIIARSRQSS